MAEKKEERGPQKEKVGRKGRSTRGLRWGWRHLALWHQSRTFLNNTQLQCTITALGQDSFLGKVYETKYRAAYLRHCRPQT